MNVQPRALHVSLLLLFRCESQNPRKEMRRFEHPWAAQSVLPTCSAHTPRLTRTNLHPATEHVAFLRACLLQSLRTATTELHFATEHIPLALCFAQSPRKKAVLAHPRKQHIFTIFAVGGASFLISFNDGTAGRGRRPWSFVVKNLSIPGAREWWCDGAGRGRGWVYMVYRVCVCGGEGKLWCFKRRGNLKEDGKENRHLFLLGLKDL